MKLYPWVENKNAVGWEGVAEWRRWLLDKFDVDEPEERIISESLDRLELKLYPLMVAIENERAGAIELLNEAVKILDGNCSTVETYQRLIGPAKVLIEKAGDE